MDSMAFSPSSKSNSKIDENQVTFGTVDFQTHRPTLALVFANLDQEMDLTIGSFNFRVGSLGFLRLSDPIPLGPSTGKTAAAETSKTSIGSSSEINSPASIKLVEGKRNIIDEIMENLDLKESSDYSNMESEGNSCSIGNYSEGEFTARYGDVSYSSEDEWMSGLELHNDEQTILSSDANHCISNQHQVYAIINETSEEFDDDNSPLINPQNIQQGAKYMADGETKATGAARVKVWLTAVEWDCGRQLRQLSITA
jgi:hypothetical protein